MRDLVQAALEELEGGRECALAVIVEHSGSTPRETGSAMLVRADGSIAGTVGGGLVEYETITEARQVIATGRPVLRHNDLDNRETGKQGMVCGGEVDVFIDYLSPKEGNYPAIYRKSAEILAQGKRAWLGFYLPGPGGEDLPCRQCLIMVDGSVIGTFAGDAGRLLTGETKLDGYDVFTVSETQRLFLISVGTEDRAIIFGGGHVSQKLAPVLAMVGFETVVMDDRAEFANKILFPAADAVVVVSSFEEDLFARVGCDAHTYCVIVTRGHAFDKEVLAQTLRTEARYIGMIGSRTKREEVYQRLNQEGFEQRDIDRVYSPIGINIGSETPEEIAISIAAEMIRVKRMGK